MEEPSNPNSNEADRTEIDKNEIDKLTEEGDIRAFYHFHARWYIVYLEKQCGQCKIDFWNPSSGFMEPDDNRRIGNFKPFEGTVEQAEKEFLRRIEHIINPFPPF